MPSSNVQNPFALTRLNSLFPGQMGVDGGWTETGLRTHVTGVDIYVDPNYPGATATADGTDPTNPLTTITAALAKCENFRGDTIHVMANDGWQYGPNSTDYTTVINEDVVVTKHGVRIVGVAPSSPLGVIWRPATAGGVACTVQALDVLIEGFCFVESSAGVGGGNGILAAWNGTTTWGDSMVVRHCYFSDSIDTAIELNYAWNCEIHDNVFQECDTCGIYCDPANSAASYIIIRDNVFHDVGESATGAVNMDEADHCTIYHNSIFNSNAVAAAVATDEGVNLANGGNNMVYENSFSCLLPAGANGDIDDLCTASATDAWVGNNCMNGLLVTNPT